MSNIYWEENNRPLKIYLGVDIGVNGGVVVLKECGAVITSFKTPETRAEFIEKLTPFGQIPSFCILERVHAQPGNGGKANFSFGRTTERTLYTLEICKIPFQEITPQQWMKTYMLKKEKSETSTQWKNRLKARAQQLFPNEKITLYLSDAFLMAEFCRRNYK